MTHARRARSLTFLLAIVSVGALAACASAPPSAQSSDAANGVTALRYVALGDSYTIGTSVPAEESWPSQLDARVESLELVANLGVNGYTSADLFTAEVPQLSDLDPDFVTILIGVNDVVQGVGEDEYARNVDLILGGVLDHVGKERVVCVATPDYTLTPRGADFGDVAQQRAAIVRFNAILADACAERRIEFVADTYEISQGVLEDPALVADDGLHPSGAQYRLWTDAIEPVVVRLLGG
jgi:acyl-CoA thioesterase I